MEPARPARAGYLRSLGALADGLLAGLQHRITLFSVELKEQKLRLVQTIIWISAAVFAGVMALTFASLTLVYLFWADARLAVLAGLAGFYIAALIGIIIAFRRHLARQSPPFAATLEELGEDRACILPGR